MININDINLNELKWKQFFDSLTPEEAEILNYDFEFLARDQQLKAYHSKKKIIALIAGRGFGKSWTLVQILRKWKDKYPSISYIPPSYSDVERILLPTLETVFPKWDKPEIKLHRGFIEFKNGSKLHVVSGESYDRIRGLNTYKCAIDELAAFQYPEEAFAQAVFSNRLGDNPQIVIATTPRPIPIIRDLLDPNRDDVEIIHGTSYDNPHIDISQMERIYGNSRIGRQELLGELLLDNPDSLWRWADIEEARVNEVNLDELTRIEIGIDPAVSNSKESDETGIIVAGIKGEDAYVLEDRSGKYNPSEWAIEAVKLYEKYKADAIVIEKNQGGNLLKNTIYQVCKTHNLDIPRIKEVWASKGKVARAEPVYIYYENRKVHHLPNLNKLEQQMTEWSYSKSNYSPDRVDALVWVLTDLYNIGKGNNNWILDW